VTATPCGWVRCCATTWETTLVDNGRAYKVVWPDGGGFNPRYRIAKEPTSYPGINADYRRTHHFHEMLRPDIFLGAHVQGASRGIDTA